MVRVLSWFGDERRSEHFFPRPLRGEIRAPAFRDRDPGHL
jgi:hypothetical protein